MSVQKSEHLPVAVWDPFLYFLAFVHNCASPGGPLAPPLPVIKAYRFVVLVTTWPLWKM